MDYSSPGSSVHGIFQARILEQVAISYSRGSPRPDSGTESVSLESPALAAGFITASVTWEAQITRTMLLLLLSRFSRVRLCATPWTAAYQAPPSLGFSRQEYWSGVSLPSPVNRF